MTWEFGNKIRFISVRGAGHEVPFWKPVESEVLFLNFIQGGLLKWKWIWNEISYISYQFEFI